MARLAPRRLPHVRAALLVSIFGTRVFAFVESEFGAVFGLAIDLLLLVTVRYVAAQEQRLQAPKEAAHVEPVAVRPAIR